MSDNSDSANGNPIDAVILWVDGSDRKLAEKRNRYLALEKKTVAHQGALPSRFASSDEIRYCVLSILTFAPFVRNIFLVTDEQDPDLDEDIRTSFPERAGCLKIVDHKEIFRGYEQYLPTFNSSSIQALIWRIEGLSENFIFFNDDVILIREIKQEDWFIGNRPVLRGKWLLPPYRKIAGNNLKVLINKHIRNKKDYQPKISFYIRQWKSASLLGMKGRYFFQCHTPHPLRRTTLENFFAKNGELLEKTISYRFRDHEQIIAPSVAYHLEILNGTSYFGKLNLGYLHPYYSENRLKRRISRCMNDFPDQINLHSEHGDAQQRTTGKNIQVDGYNFKFASENVISMTSNKPPESKPPIDVVIAWVDGDDPKLAKKRNNFVKGTKITIGSGAHSTRFASSNEIRYCLLSIMRFAPFVRNIFIVTDEQDPDIYNDVSKYFPEKLNSIRIVDHKEIFEGYENCLPTFNSISIANMIWRIKGLSENFVYFNDDTFLIRSIKPEEWFVVGRPVIRGRWVPAPVPRIIWNSLRISFNRHLLGKPDFEPRASFHMGQWNAAPILGFKFRYFTNSHTPHAVNRKLIEDYFSKNNSLLIKNISFRFRDHSQFTFISLSNHLQLA